MQRDLLNVYLNFNTVNGDKLVSSVKSTFEQINAVVKNYTPAFPLNMDVKQIDKQLKVVTDEIMDYFPQSPAKKGALRGLENAGSEIIGQLMLGMDSSAYRLYKSVEYIASQILQPFKNLKEEFTEALSFNIDMTTYERYKYLENIFDISKSKLNEVSKRLKQLDYVQEKAVMSRMGGLDADNAMSHALRRADKKNTIDDLRYNAGLPGDILNNLKYIRKDIREILAKQIENLQQPFSDEIYTKILNIETLFKSLTYSSVSLKDKAIVETLNWLFPNVEEFLSGLVGYDVKIESILKDLSQFIQDIFNRILHFYTNNLKNFSLKDLFNSIFGGTKSELEAISDEFQWKLSNIPEQRLNTGLSITADKAINYYGKKILDSNNTNIKNIEDLNFEIKKQLQYELDYLRKNETSSNYIPLIEKALERIGKKLPNEQLFKQLSKKIAPDLAQNGINKGLSLTTATANAGSIWNGFTQEDIMRLRKAKLERNQDVSVSNPNILSSIEQIQKEKAEESKNIIEKIWDNILLKLNIFREYLANKVDASPFLKKIQNIITYFYDEFIQKPLDYAEKTNQNGFLTVFFNFMRIFWENLKGAFNNILDEENGWLGRIIKYFKDKFNALKKWLGFEKQSNNEGSGGSGANTNGLDVDKAREQVYDLSTATAGNDVVNDTGGAVWEFTEKAQGFLDSVWLFLDDVYTSITAFIENTIEKIKNSEWFQSVFGDFVSAFDSFINGEILNGILLSFQGLAKIFTALFDFFIDFLNMIYPHVENFVKKSLDMALKILDSVSDKLFKIVKTVLEVIIKALNTLRGPILNLLKSIIEVVFDILLHGVLNPLMTQLRTTIVDIVDHVFKLIKDLLGSLISIALESILDGIRWLIDVALRELIVMAMWNVGEAIYNALRDVHDKIVEEWENHDWPYIKSVGQIIYYNVAVAFRRIKERVTAFITERIEYIKNKLYAIIKKLKFWESDENNSTTNVATSSSGGGGGAKVKENAENTEDTEHTEITIVDTIAKLEENTKNIKESNENQLDEQKEQNKNNEKQLKNQEQTNELLNKQLEEDKEKDKSNGISGILAKYFSGAYNVTSTTGNSNMPPLPTFQDAKEFFKSLIPGDLLGGLFGGSAGTTATATTDTNSNDETSQGNNNSTDNNILEKAYETIKQYTNTDEIEKITNKMDNLLAVANDYPGIIEEFGVNTNQVLKEFIGKLSKLEPNKENLKVLLNNSQDELINEFYGEIEAKYTQTNLDKVLEQWRTKFDEIKRYGLEIPQELVDKASESIYSSIGTEALEKGFDVIREKIKAFEEECKIEIPIQLPIKEVGLAVSNMEQLMGNLYKLSGEQSKEFYTAQKAMSIISATISTYEAATNALKTGVYPMNLVNAGIVTAVGLANVALIASQSFSSGGQVQGKNTGKDDVPAMLMAGEYVIKKKAVDYLGLDYLNNLNNLTPQSTTSSSDVTPAFTAQAQENQVRQPINNEISIVNYTDIKQFSQFLNTEEGKKSIVNIVAEKSSQLRSFFR